MERCLGAGGLPSGAATLRLRLAVVRAVATAATGISGRRNYRRGWLRLHPVGKIINKRHYY